MSDKADRPRQYWGDELGARGSDPKKLLGYKKHVLKQVTDQNKKKKKSDGWIPAASAGRRQGAKPVDRAGARRASRQHGQH